MAATNQGRKIVKNTIILYIRTLLVMAITLFTSRVVLNALGVDDYGIYNVVGGLVAMFAVLSSSLSNAISRFITYELGHGDKDKLRIIFSSGVNILLGISILIIIVGEVIGIWFLNNKMTIPLDRLYAANWVLQFCLLTFCINLVSVPYNAAIIAHERMSAFAYVSLLDAALTLGVAYLISVSPFDKLITYGFLLMMIKLIIRLIYGIYCKKKFEECSYKYVYDKIIYKEMINFAQPADHIASGRSAGSPYRPYRHPPPSMSEHPHVHTQDYNARYTYPDVTTQTRYTNRHMQRSYISSVGMYSYTDR